MQPASAMTTEVGVRGLGGGRLEEQILLRKLTFFFIVLFDSKLVAPDHHVA